MCDRDSIRSKNKDLHKKQNIYCNTAKGLYGRLTTLHHSSDIIKEQHRKLLPFSAFRREKIDSISYDCKNKIDVYDKVPIDSYAYGIVKISECLDANDLVDIVNETLTKNEQIKILKRKM